MKKRAVILALFGAFTFCSVGAATAQSHTIQLCVESNSNYYDLHLIATYVGMAGDKYTYELNGWTDLYPPRPPVFGTATISDDVIDWGLTMPYTLPYMWLYTTNFALYGAGEIIRIDGGVISFITIIPGPCPSCEDLCEQAYVQCLETGADPALCAEIYDNCLQGCSPD
jgi:hypothetical protein